MRIGIDARAAVDVTDGIGRYAHELLKAYAGMDNDVEYCVLKNPRTPLSFAFDRRFREIVVSSERFGPGEQVSLPRLLSGLRLDLFHSLHATLPLGYGGVKVTTIHDIFPLLLPWSFGGSGLKNAFASTYYGLLVDLSLRRARLAIVDSDATARDVRSRFGGKLPGLRRIYLGIDHIRPPAAAQGAPEVRPPYLLTVTNFKPHKNTENVIAAFRTVRESIPGLTLAVVGHDARARAESLGRPEELRAQGVRLLGYVEDDVLAGLLASAEAFVYPSLYEGFGFPVLEAMASGVPVITSSSASLPELGGDAVLYADPRDVPAIAAAILRVCGDSALRDDLRTRGLRRASGFRWGDTARETFTAYGEAVGTKGGAGR